MSGKTKELDKLWISYTESTPSIRDNKEARDVYKDMARHYEELHGMSKIVEKENAKLKAKLKDAEDMIEELTFKNDIDEMIEEDKELMQELAKMEKELKNESDRWVERKEMFVLKY